jgi:hypothetical protein
MVFNERRIQLPEQKFELTVDACRRGLVYAGGRMVSQESQASFEYEMEVVGEIETRPPGRLVRRTL